MGYRSEVKLITTKEGWKKIEQAVKQASPDNYEYLLADEYVCLIRNGEYVLYEVSDIKWYDTPPYGFPEIIAFKQALYNLDEDDIPYEFMRVGEDYTDVEYLPYRVYKDKYQDMPTLGLERTIEVEY